MLFRLLHYHTFIHAASTVAYATFFPHVSLVNNGPILFGEVSGEGQFSMGLSHEASGKPLEEVRQISLVLKQRLTKSTTSIPSTLPYQVIVKFSGVHVKVLNSGVTLSQCR